MWVLLILLVVLLVTGLALWLRERRQWSRLVAMAEDLATGRPVGMERFDSPRFRQLALLLSGLADQHQGMERRLEHDNLELQAILKNLVEGLMVVDEKHVIQRANDSLVSLFKLKSDPVGQTVLGALREAAVEEVVVESFASSQAVSREFELFRGAQAPRHFTVNAVPRRKLGGSVREVVVVVHDITNLRQMEVMQREFVANVSHELRTPLSIFQGYVETLIDYPAVTRKELLATLEVMRRHSLRLNALLEDLQTLARMEASRDPLNYSLLALRPMFERLAEDWRSKLQTKNISMALEVAGGTTVLYADEFRFEQVMVNLIDNALKYTPEGGRIWIKASSGTGQGEVEIKVGDTGVGIPPSDIPFIFDRFYRVEKARSRDAGGTGLGLAIVKHIIGLHGGAVAAESVYGSGTTIVMRFPGPPANVVNLPAEDRPDLPDQVAG
jgi:two-component system phosphate regulon sensor histidine kinase PhoR